MVPITLVFYHEPAQGQEATSQTKTGEHDEVGADGPPHLLLCFFYFTTTQELRSLHLVLAAVNR